MKRFEDKRQEQLYNLLMNPIECITNNEKMIFKKNGKIYSSQKYICDSGIKNLDQDMSDFSVGFYEILYKKYFNNFNILKDSGKLQDKQLAGDTMNSFNSIANCTSGVGKSVKDRTTKNEWPEYLQKYEEKYHCLANFWILPYELGRSGKKGNYYDSVDVMLNRVKNDYNVIGKYSKYTENIDTYDEFCSMNMLGNYVIDTEIITKYQKGNSKEIIDHIIENIEERAVYIANSEITSEVMEYFKECRIWEEN